MLIFDNVENPALLNSYWQKGANGVVLVTIKNLKIARLYPVSKIEVWPFSEVASPDYLLRIVYGGIDENYALINVVVTTEDKVANGLGNLPLALCLIGSYAASSSMGYADL